MKKKILWVIGLFLFSFAAAASDTQVTFYGHAAFRVITPKGVVLMVDPWLSNPLDPLARNGKDPVAAIPRADYILITHGHSDHVGNAVELGKKTGARLVTNFELGTNLVRAFGFPKKQAGMDTLFNVGGQITIADGEVKVSMVPAIHSSGMDPGGNAPMIYGGTAAGFVLEIKNGPTIYTTGDTAYFSDMALIGKRFAPDLAFINIGGHFGMEPAQAVEAAAAVKAKLCVPMHYGTFPILTQSPEQFVLGLTRKHINYRVMSPGSSIRFRGKKLVK